MGKPDIKLIVGLGNIGPEYEATRHNIGFWFVDELARRAGARFNTESRFHGNVARGDYDGCEIRLLKPSTYMNRSGDAVAPLANFFKLSPAQILVVHDDLDLVPGAMKLKFGGGNGGHNGLRDISLKLGNNDYWRLRVGIGHPNRLNLPMGVADFVLGTPSNEHQSAIDECLTAALNGLGKLLAGDVQAFERHIGKYSSSKHNHPSA